MKITRIVLVLITGGLFFGPVKNVQAREYSPGPTTTKTTVRTYHTTPKTHPASSLGTYCLHEPGDDYGLSYGGCEYDGGYGGQQTNVYVRGGTYVYGGSGLIIRSNGFSNHLGRRVYKH